MVHFRCPHCREINKLPGNQPGDIVECAACHKRSRTNGQPSPVKSRQPTARPSPAAAEAVPRDADEPDFSNLAAEERECDAVEGVTQRGMGSDGLTSKIDQLVELWDVLCETRKPSWADTDKDVAVANVSEKSGGNSIAGGIGNVAGEVVGRAIGHAIGEAVTANPAGFVVAAVGLGILGAAASKEDDNPFAGRSDNSPVAKRIRWRDQARQQLEEIGFITKPIDRLGELVSAIRYGAIDALLTMLSGAKNDADRQQVFLAIGYLGDAAASAVPRLLPYLKSQKEETRRRAALALAEIGPAAEEAVPVLLKRIIDGSDDPKLAGQYVAAISQIEPLTDRVWPALIRCMRDPNQERQEQALAVFLKVPQPIAKTAVRQLVSAVKASPNRQTNLARALQAARTGSSQEPWWSAVVRQLQRLFKPRKSDQANSR